MPFPRSQKLWAALSPDEVELLQNSDSDLQGVLERDDGSPSRLASILVNLLQDANYRSEDTDNNDELEFYLSMIHAILILDPRELALASKQTLQRRARLFSPETTSLDTEKLLTLLSHASDEIKNLSCAILGRLVMSLSLPFESVITWCIQSLARWDGRVSTIRIPSQCLSTLLRQQGASRFISDSDGIAVIAHILSQNPPGTQTLYELCIVLWSLSFNRSFAVRHQFVASGAVRSLVIALGQVSSKKVMRMCAATLANLCIGENEIVIMEMLSNGLEKSLATIHALALVDEELVSDIAKLSAMASSHRKELTTFERFEQEVAGGALKWGPLHTEKFWRENARKMEKSDFELIFRLIQLLVSADDVVKCVALNDLGEFCRYYPNGRDVIKGKGGKDIVLRMVEDSSLEISRHALGCASKLMISKWDSVA